MGLHDVDKTADTRGVPKPNADDNVLDRLAHGTTQAQNAQEAGTNGLKVLERQIVAVQGGVNKAIFGFYGTANKFGLKVAQDGIDVISALESQLVFNSERDVLKVLKTGTLTMLTQNVSSGNEVTRTLTVDFSDAYGDEANGDTPAVLAYGKYGSSDYFLWAGIRLFSYAIGAGTGVTHYGEELFSVDVNTSTATFTAKYLNGAGGGPVATNTYLIKYFIFVNSVS